MYSTKAPRDTGRPRPAPLNPHALTSLYKLACRDIEAFSSILETAVQTLQENMSEIRAGAKHADLRGVAFAANNLQSNAAALGSSELEALARRAEYCARALDHAGLHGLLPSLTAEVVATCETVNTLNV